MTKVKIVKIISMVASVAGMLGTAWASDKQNKIDLALLVDQRLGK